MASIRILVIIFLGILSNGPLMAQEDPVQFSQLNQDQGLSHNEVHAILKDKTGFLWFGTLSGLNKYDGHRFKVFKHISEDTNSLNDDHILKIEEGPQSSLWVQTPMGYNIYNPLSERFSHNINGFLNSIKINDRHISDIKKDRFGDYWFLNGDSGLYQFHSIDRKVRIIPLKKLDPAYGLRHTVCDLELDPHGNIWILFSDGLLIEMDSKTLKIKYKTGWIHQMNPKINGPFKLFIDSDGDLYAFIKSFSTGVYFINASKTDFRHIEKGDLPNNLNTNVVSDIIQNTVDQIWIATDHGGINVLNKKNFKIRFIQNREGDFESLGQNSIVSMVKDYSGIVWIGTYRRGLSYYHDNIKKFPLYSHQSLDPSSLPFNDINKFVEDKKGNIWIGSNGGGLIYFNPQTRIFKTYLHDASNPKSLTNNIIVSLYLDHEQKLWIGTYFGGLDCFDGKVFSHYKHQDNNPLSLSDDRVWSILEDSEQNLWVGTLAGGINILNKNRTGFIHIKAGPGNTIHSNYVSNLLEDKEKNLWIVTSYGIDVLVKKTHQFIHYLHDDHNPNTLINDNTNNIFLDSRGLLWISTREGISILNPKTNTFKNINKEDGLPANTCLDIQEDRDHEIWVSTINGLSNIRVFHSGDSLKLNFVNYNERDGLQGKVFSINASCRTHTDQLIFGGYNGFNIFNPSNIHFNSELPNLVLTDFQVFNRSIKVGEKINGHVLLEKSINQTSSINLTYNDNVFSFEFASLDYFNPEKVEMNYKMEGFDKGWIHAENGIFKAGYTNLDPGDYVFKVHAFYPNSRESEISLPVHILPPFWKTSIAYILYVFVLLGFIFLLRKRGIRKLRNQFALEKEREATKRMHELDLMKIKFFTNVSHEFRTPLSLIMAPIDKVLKHVHEPELKSQLEFANKNAKRLLNLVNQLLDFRKMEFQELKLHLKSGDIIGFIKEIAYSFSDIGEKKNISFAFDSEMDELFCEFDDDKIERILFNILSNAFKFTPSGGHVSFLVYPEENDKPGFYNLIIKVVDTGIGIPLENRIKIFDPFFQNDLPGSMINEGSGIGLSITKEFIRLHGGKIYVESEPNEGSCFIIQLCLKESSKEKMEAIKNPKEELGLSVNASMDMIKPFPVSNPKKPSVLIVEDNSDFRFYIKDNLKNSFHILEAADGKEGWQKTLAYHPNLVVSDINMPEMNGIELCQKIKGDGRTTHIPVILLTAITGEDQQLRGLETGATDYLTKPFNFEILHSKIRNILSQQENMRRTYQKQLEVRPNDEIVESPDEVFLQKCMRHIGEQISNPNYSVEELSEEMCVSRYTLYKKILALTGKTPNEFIRNIRLKRAAQLLESGYLTISQICYKVGFKSQKYFVKAFKNEFQVKPSHYMETKSEPEMHV